MSLKLVILVLFAAVSIAHLVSIFFKKGTLKAVLKGCLMPLVLAIYLISAEKVLLLIVLALVFGWAGDLFLIKIKDIRCFRFGLASFLIGHICYIIAMLGFGRPFNFTVLAISAISAACLGVALFKFIRPTNEMKIPVIAYETVIMTMAIFAIQLFLSQRGAFGALVLAGSVCFVASDSTLAFVTFRKESKFGEFIVMLTYIAAQFLIAWGFTSRLI